MSAIPNATGSPRATTVERIRRRYDVEEGRPSLTRRLTREARSREVTETDRAQAERYVHDWLGSYVAGRAAPTGRILTAYGGEADDQESRLFLAVALSHVIETDDLHRASVTHP